MNNYKAKVGSANFHEINNLIQEVANTAYRAGTRENPASAEELRAAYTKGFDEGARINAQHEQYNRAYKVGLDEGIKRTNEEYDAKSQIGESE